MHIDQSPEAFARALLPLAGRVSFAVATERLPSPSKVQRWRDALLELTPRLDEEYWPADFLEIERRGAVALVLIQALSLTNGPVGAEELTLIDGALERAMYLLTHDDWTTP